MFQMTIGPCCIYVSENLLVAAAILAERHLQFRSPNALTSDPISPLTGHQSLRVLPTVVALLGYGMMLQLPHSMTLA